MLVHRLLAFSQFGAEWVLWLLLALSVASVAITIERARFYAARARLDVDALLPALLAGEFAKAREAVGERPGMEADVVRAASAHSPLGADALAEVIEGTVERARIEYERRLAFLGTLGNNAPFVGLFGTVLGIIRAFSDLAGNPGAAGTGTVMAGIGDALVATGVGLFVALPAVVAFNFFQRALRRATQRAQALGHAAVARMKAR
jgi:biopolymer transport protein ExbB